MKFSTESDIYFRIDVIEKVVQDTFLLHNTSDTHEACIAHLQSIHSDSFEIKVCARFLETSPLYMSRYLFEDLGIGRTKPPSIQ